MKTLALIAALSASLVAPAFAGDAEYLTVKQVAEITGMHEREVQMMVAPAHSTSLLFLTSYNRVSREWNQALAANDLILSYVTNAKGDRFAVVSRASNKDA